MQKKPDVSDNILINIFHNKLTITFSYNLCKGNKKNITCSIKFYRVSKHRNHGELYSSKSMKKWVSTSNKLQQNRFLEKCVPHTFITTSLKFSQVPTVGTPSKWRINEGVKHKYYPTT